jgi:hypothetical protein
VVVDEEIRIVTKLARVSPHSLLRSKKRKEEEKRPYMVLA